MGCCQECGPESGCLCDPLHQHLDPGQCPLISVALQLSFWVLTLAYACRRWPGSHFRMSRLFRSSRSVNCFKLSLLLLPPTRTIPVVRKVWIPREENVGESGTKGPAPGFPWQSSPLPGRQGFACQPRDALDTGAAGVRGQASPGLHPPSRNWSRAWLV